MFEVILYLRILYLQMLVVVHSCMFCIIFESKPFCRKKPLSACLARPHNPHGRAQWFSQGPPPPLPPPPPPVPAGPRPPAPEVASPGMKQPMTPPKAPHQGQPPKAQIRPSKIPYVPPVRPSPTAMSSQSQPITPEEAFMTSPKKQDCPQRAFKYLWCTMAMFSQENVCTIYLFGIPETCTCDCTFTCRCTCVLQPSWQDKKALGEEQEGKKEEKQEGQEKFGWLHFLLELPETCTCDCTFTCRCTCVLQPS